MAFVLLDFPKVHILSLWYNPVNFWRDNRQWVAWLSFLRTILKLTFSVRGTNPSTFGVMTGCGMRGRRSRHRPESHGRAHRDGARRPLPSHCRLISYHAQPPFSPRGGPFFDTRRPLLCHTEALFFPRVGPFFDTHRPLTSHARAPFWPNAPLFLPRARLSSWHVHAPSFPRGGPFP
jgi:hypothetical protein